ncbi:MAG TPA: SRPBCC family protein, partial [Opitutus sp.]|nr:SRPBCC family protein [Opitutus sp.]
MPAANVKVFRWTLDLRAPPAALWPLVSNTDRFNRDCGYPPVKAITPPADRAGRATNARRLRASVLGLPIIWEEYAFEWIEPVRFSVVRDYSRGPVARMVLNCELQPRPDGGTALTYEMQLTPAHLLGRLLLPVAVGRRVRSIVARVLHRYDEFALRGLATS